MEDALTRAEGLIRTPSFPPNQRQAFASICHSDRLALEMLQNGPTPELEAAYQSLLLQAGGESQRVGIRLQLAKCALARGDSAATREHLEYIKAHGNKLFTRQRAEALLSTMDH